MTDADVFWACSVVCFVLSHAAGTLERWHCFAAHIRYSRTIRRAAKPSDK